MEPFEFDQLIRKRLTQENEAHTHEIKKSRPFVWSAIQKELGKNTSSLKWYHLAAAVILLFICFSFLIRFMQHEYTSNIKLLSQQVEGIKDKYDSKLYKETIREQQLSSLSNEIKQLEQLIVDLKKQKKRKPEKQLIYRTDTVFVRQIEYITKYIPQIEEKKNNRENTKDREKNIETDDVDKPDQMIYPDYTNSEQRTHQNEGIKFKLVAFTSK